jgi:transposase-like protein
MEETRTVGILIVTTQCPNCKTFLTFKNYKWEKHVWLCPCCKGEFLVAIVVPAIVQPAKECMRGDA